MTLRNRTAEHYGTEQQDNTDRLIVKDILQEEKMTN